MDEKDTATGKAQANPGYALFQLAKAFTTSTQHEDPVIRERAQLKLSKWMAVFEGLLNGTLKVGTRTPLAGAPGWLTLEVVTGGFATGELLAGGPLLDHERVLLAKLAPVSGAAGREALNGYYLTAEGLTLLQEQLSSGCYEVTVPEEGALLVVAWLVKSGNVEAARNLLEELVPYFSQVRFYAIPTERPRQAGSRVFLQTVGRTLEDLNKIKPNPRILAQKEAIEIWAPLYDRMIELFLETVVGESPRLQGSPDGERRPLQNGKFPVVGGWPCQNYPAGWSDRAQRVLNDYQHERAAHPLCGKPDRAKDSFAQLRHYLQRCMEAPGSLSGREVGRIRLILARHLTKCGAPASVQWNKLRHQQTQQTSAPTFFEISRVVIPRLAAQLQTSGLDDLDALVQPITAAEAEQYQLPAGTRIPETQQRKIRRGLWETVDVLVRRKIITSGEMLARVLPQMTSQIRAAGIAQPALRQLYSAIYQAFRRRRSLLLLNLESQIKLEELPWVAALERFRHDSLSTRELAKQSLEEVTLLTFVSFPYAILPNKLLQELRTLAKGAGLNLPLVEEVAADIFMGQFSDKFLQAAKQAADVLEGTLYETYYGIDYRVVRRMPASERPKLAWFARPPADAFAALCSARAGVTYKLGDPAVNGMIIEQQQILTTQNLAVLFAELNLVDRLGGQLEGLAQECFRWLCRRQQVKTDQWHARLIVLKNTAYAWRQMIFFLALLPPARVQTFLAWAAAHLSEQTADFQTRFRPALTGLAWAAEGRSLPDSSAGSLEARRFLGWSKSRHWLLD